MKYDIKSLTLEEKLKLLCGKDHWTLETANGKLKEVFLADGPSGLRKMTEVKENGKRETIKSTAMPTLSVVANTWNLEMAKLDASTIADECIEEGADVLLAPGVNIKRTPLNGRNFEYFSEDPILSGQMGKAYIEGLQEKGIGASLKHYLGNNREVDRLFQTSEIDERTLREIYLTPFEIALEAKPWTVMCSYNPVNGVYSSENKYVLKDILRDELDYDGVIVSDWGAVRNPWKAVKATLDLEMPGGNLRHYGIVKTAYEKGLITDEEIDFCVNNLLKLIEKTENDKKKITFTKEERHANAVKIAEEGIVLLKNDDNILPIKSGTAVVCGNQANVPQIGGTGSSFVQTDFKQEHIVKYLNENSGAKFYTSRTTLAHKVNAEQVDLLRLAYDLDNVILCLSDEVNGEAYDRMNIRLSPFVEQQIIKIAEVNPNVIVCLYGGSAIDMSAWIDKVKAVVWVGYAGEGVNQALANILTGKVVPSGKLAETMPINIDTTYTKMDMGGKGVERYTDGVFVGYRYYESYKIPVQFPFGHGLSYAGFTYSNLKIEKHGETDYTVSYDITNNSSFDAKEVSQVYVKDMLSMVSRPLKELKAFSKDIIPAKSTKTITRKLSKRAFAYYNTVKKDWHVENGAFEILVGSSSSDIKLKQRIDIRLPNEEQFSSNILTYNTDDPDVIQTLFI